MQFTSDTSGSIKIIWSFAEVKTRASILKFIQAESLTAQQKINFLLTIDIWLIILIAEEHDKFAQWLRGKDLENYWQEVWKLFGQFPSWLESQRNQNLIYRKLIPQPNISCFTLVRGMCFYKKASDLFVETKNFNDPIFRHFLYKAAAYHNFTAFEMLTKFTIDSKDLKLLDANLQLLLASVNYHGTPVYILCALTCLEVASYHRSQSEKVAQSAAEQMTFQYLYAALYAENFSSAAIHNAYFGLGLGQSNQWGITQISKLISHLKDVLNLSDSNAIVLQAQQQGKNIAQALKQQQPVDTNPSVNRELITLF